MMVFTCPIMAYNIHAMLRTQYFGKIVQDNKYIAHP